MTPELMLGTQTTMSMMTLIIPVQTPSSNQSSSVANYLLLTYHTTVLQCASSCCWVNSLIHSRQPHPTTVCHLCTDSSHLTHVISSLSVDPSLSPPTHPRLFHSHFWLKNSPTSQILFSTDYWSLGNAFTLHALGLGKDVLC